jgi:cyclic pyranopterin phosphate synthase
MKELSHVNQENFPEMVDVSSKKTTERQATARAVVTLDEKLSVFHEGKEIQTPKGAVLATAIIAGTLAAKKTSSLIPFCHGLNLADCKFSFRSKFAHTLEIFCTVKTCGQTGVEMEALTGATIAALTVYDMCKSLTHEIVLGPIELMAKSGGKNDFSKL